MSAFGVGAIAGGIEWDISAFTGGMSKVVSAAGSLPGVIEEAIDAPLKAAAKSAADAMSSIDRTVNDAFASAATSARSSIGDMKDVSASLREEWDRTYAHIQQKQAEATAAMAAKLPTRDASGRFLPASGPAAGSAGGVGDAGSQSLARAGHAAAEATRAVENYATAATHGGSASAVMGAQTSSLSGLLGGAVTVAAGAATAIAAVGTAAFAAAHKLLEMAQAEAAAMMQTSLLAEKSGVTAEYFEELAAAGAHVKVSQDSIAAGFRFLQMNAAGAVEGNQQAAESFARIGLSLDDLKADLDDSGDLFKKVLEGVQQIPDAAERLKSVRSILGRGGADLIPLFDMPKEVMDQHVATAREAGAIHGKAAEDAARAWTSAGVEFDQIWAGVTAKLSEPIMQFVIDDWKEFKPLVEDVAKSIETILLPLIKNALDMLKEAKPLLEFFADIFRDIGTLTQMAFGNGPTTPSPAQLPAAAADTGDFNGRGFRGGAGFNPRQVNITTTGSAKDIAEKLEPYVRKQQQEDQRALLQRMQHRTVSGRVGGIGPGGGF